MKRMEPLKRNEQRKNDEVPYKNKNNGVNRSIPCIVVWQVGNPFFYVPDYNAWYTSIDPIVLVLVWYLIILTLFIPLQRLHPLHGFLLYYDLAICP